MQVQSLEAKTNTTEEIEKPVVNKVTIIKSMLLNPATAWVLLLSLVSWFSLKSGGLFLKEISIAGLIVVLMLASAGNNENIKRNLINNK